MMKFTCFERTIEALYKYVVPKPREQCTKTEKLGVAFVAGYIAGIFCAVVSHPADTIVSKLNNEKGLSLFDAVRRVGFAGKSHARLICPCTRRASLQGCGKALVHAFS